MADLRQASSHESPGHAFDRDEADFSGERSPGNLVDFPQPARASAADLLVLQRVVALEILPRVVRAHGADLAQASPRTSVPLSAAWALNIPVDYARCSRPHRARSRSSASSCSISR